MTSKDSEFGQFTGPRLAKRIGVFGHVGNGNLGDEAIISAVIQNIKYHDPTAEICGFTINPIDTRERHKIPAFPIRRIDKIQNIVKSYGQNQANTKEVALSANLLQQAKDKLRKIPIIFTLLKSIQRILHILPRCFRESLFLIQCYRSLKGVDLLLIAGSQQLIDYVGAGPWGHPYTLFKWLLIAKIAYTKVAFVSVGAGPVNSSLGKFFIKNSLKLSTYRSYRDNASREYIKLLGISGQANVFPDLAYSLCLKERSTHTVFPKPRIVIGINPVPFNDPKYWVGSSEGAYKTFVRTLADFALWLVQNGYQILFFPTQLNLDPPVIEDIRIAMIRDGITDFELMIIDYSIKSFDDLVSAISMMDLVVATRFHGVVIPYLLNKPTLGIAYAEKTKDLMQQMGQGEYALDIFNLELGLLQDKFLTLESQKELMKEKIQQGVSKNRLALELQYKQAFELLEKH